LPFFKVQAGPAPRDRGNCVLIGKIPGRQVVMVYRRIFPALLSHCIFLAFGLPAARAETGGTAQNAAESKSDSASPFAPARKLLQLGKYDEAIELMKSKTFAAVEGANLNVPEHWTDAHLLRGQARLNAKRYKEALADFDAALHLPANLPAGLGFAEGSGGAARAAEIAWWTGEAYEATGDREKASAAWQRGATAGSPERRWRRGPMTPSSQSYYQALCLQKVGQNEKATAQLKGLVDAGRGMLGDSARLRVARGHYLAGLGYVGLNDREKGRAELQEAVTMSPDLVGARSALGWLTNE